MSILEVLGWCLVVCTVAACSVMALGMLWARYCSWSIQREREWFWRELRRKMELKARLMRERYVVPEGPYR